MGLECRDIVVDRIEKYSIDCDLKVGYLDLALRDADRRMFESWIAEKSAAAYPHRLQLLGKEEMRTVIGSDAYVGAS